MKMQKNPEEAKVALLAITKHGIEKAVNLFENWPSHLELPTIITSDKFEAVVSKISNDNKFVYSGALKPNIEKVWNSFDQIVGFVSLGAIVRLIAPFIKDKETDPAVIVIDDAGEYVIPVLSGHVGGANEWSEKIAAIINAKPVLTTASDARKTIAVDILGRHLGWKIQAPKVNITRVSAHVVNGEKIAIVQNAGEKNWWTRDTPLPDNIEILNSISEVRENYHKALLLITNDEINDEIWDKYHEALIVYRP